MLILKWPRSANLDKIPKLTLGAFHGKLRAGWPSRAIAARQLQGNSLVFWEIHRLNRHLCSLKAQPSLATAWQVNCPPVKSCSLSQPERHARTWVPFQIGR